MRWSEPGQRAPLAVVPHVERVAELLALCEGSFSQHNKPRKFKPQGSQIFQSEEPISHPVWQPERSGKTPRRICHGGIGVGPIRHHKKPGMLRQADTVLSG
jgi:hypothetical protein